MATNIERVRRAVAQTPWAILPEKLEQICEFLAARAEGRLSEAEVQAAAAQQRRGETMQAGGVAVLPVFGTISQRLDLLSAMSGGASTERIGKQFDQYMADPDIGTIVLHVDSPGGSVPGVMELSNKIYNARGQGKRIIAVADSMAASAAYWIATAADDFVVTPSGYVGSIGVYTLHVDFSRALDMEGITPTFIKAGRHKTDGNPYEPLSDSVRDHVQAQINEIYDEFVGAVARNRGVTVAKVESGFGQGRVLKAKPALAAGMVDRIATFDEVLADLGVKRSREGARIAAVDTPAAAGTATANQVTAESGALRISDAGAAEAIHTETPLDAAGDVSTEEPSPGSEPASEARENAMSDRDKAVAGNGAGTAEDVRVSVGSDATAAERKRSREIIEMCHEHGMADKAAEFIESGRSADAVGREILSLKRAELKPVSPPSPKQLVSMSEGEEKRYSMHRALLAAADNDYRNAGFELEIHQEIESKLKRPAKGIYIPTGLGGFGAPRAALDTATTTGGEELVFTQRGSFIDMLRSRLVLSRMGATFLPGLVGDVAFPRQTGAATLEWRGQSPGSDQSDSELTLDQLVLSPKEAQATTAFSRRLLAQSTPMVEGIVRNDFAAIAARGVDKAGLHGTGQNNQPTGVYAASGVNSVAMGGGISWDKVVELETAIAEADGDIGAMGYVTTPGVRGAAKTTQKFADTNGQPIWSGSVEEGEMNGYRALASTQVRSDLGSASPPVEHGILFGVWSELYIGEWGALELIVDPYSKKKQALIEVTIHLMADVGLRHAEAFSKGTGLTVS